MKFHLPFIDFRIAVWYNQVNQIIMFLNAILKNIYPECEEDKRNSVKKHTLNLQMEKENMSERKPMLLVFADPNGSGKSTITQYFDKVGIDTMLII